MILQVDEYVDWFTKVPIQAVNNNRELMNNLFVMVQHIKAIDPSFPVKFISGNQASLNKILEAFDIKEELIRAYKEVLAENK